ncbi:MAG: flippase-like domain-containing protein [Isosphaeraceae bacterium]|nr:flippase-like domain-containing protein [Isosphaeraceae bacterium]
MNRRPSDGSPWRSFTIRAGIALGLLALAVATNRDQIRQVLGRQIDLRLFALGFGLYISGVMLAFVRWYFLVRAVELPFRMRDAFRLGFVGTLFNFVIPGAIGGDFVKAAYISREQERKARAIATVVIDRLVGLLGLFGLAALAGTLGWGRLDPPVRRLVASAWIASAVVALLLGLAFAPGLYGRLSRRARRRRVAHALAELDAAGSAYRDCLGVVVLGSLLGGLTHTLNVLAFYADSVALFPEVPSLTDHLLIVPLVLFSTAVPLPFGALGVSEQVSFGLFRLADYKGGAVAMMAFHLLQGAGALIGAAVYMANRREVKTLQAEEEFELDTEPV